MKKKRSMSSKQYSLDFGSSDGFTLIELLVAMALGMIMSSLSLAAILSNRRLYQYDLVRTRINQDLRSSLDILGVNVREAGENLSPIFPAIEVIDGGVDSSDILIIRRNLVDEVLKLCQPLTAGSSTNTVYFAYPGTEPGCAYDDQEHNFNRWADYRQEYMNSHNSMHPKAYIYDPDNQVGEFFDYSNEISTATTRHIERSWGHWENDYTVGNSGVYLIEEWHFRIDKDWEEDDVFQVIENNDMWNPKNIMYNITGFDIQVHLANGTTVSSFPVGANWTTINALEISVSGEDIALGDVITRDYTARFFPRNILSH